MIFGMKPASLFVMMTGVLCAVCIALVEDTRALSDGGHPGESWTVEQLVASVRNSRGSTRSFEEAIYSSLLDKPLIVRGVLRFTPPLRLEKDVQEPYRERYLVEGDRVTFESERRHVTKTISLDDYPGLRGFVDAFRATLAGDVTRLTQAYDTALDGTRRKWTLSLRPRDKTGKSMVKSIELSGSEGRIDMITVYSPDGDRSVMTLSQEPIP